MKKLLHVFSWRGVVNRRSYWYRSLVLVLPYAAFIALCCLLGEGLFWHHEKDLQPLGGVLFLLMHAISLPAAMLHPLADATWVLVPPAIREFGLFQFRSGILPGLTSGVPMLDTVLVFLLPLGLVVCSLSLMALSVRRLRDVGKRFWFLPTCLLAFGILTTIVYGRADLWDIFLYQSSHCAVLAVMLAWCAFWYIVQVFLLSLPTRQQFPNATDERQEG